jgi:hypothetical protein
MMISIVDEIGINFVENEMILVAIEAIIIGVEENGMMEGK